MYFAVNYSQAAHELLNEGKIQVDRFKCPAWPDLVTSLRDEHPIYIHFPFRVGMGTGEVLNTETQKPVDWSWAEDLLAQTDTPWVSLHLGPKAEDHPDIPPETTASAYIARITEALIRDVSAAVNRLGPERVVGENIFGFSGMHLRPACLPEVLHRVIDETGCGFLLDVSHARLAARELGMDPKTYLNALPITRIREMHITGLQRFEGRWLDLAHRAGVTDEELRGFTGELIDHLPLTDKDWRFVAWVTEQIKRGAWQEPWVVGFEYGGVGAMYQATTIKSVLAEQVPRLRTLLQGNTLTAP